MIMLKRQYIWDLTNINTLKTIMFLLALYFTGNVYACDISRAFTSVATLQNGNFSAGQDMAVGSVIRVQRVNATNTQNPLCASPAYLTFVTSGGMLYPGTTYVYQTGIDGVGVRFRNVRTGFYFGNNQTLYVSGTLGTPTFSFDMEFIVMGPITGGGINSSGFPSVSVNITNGYNATYPLATYNFSGGTFNIQVPTCTTPNYTYNLGTYGLSNFSGGTQVSPWMDTPITLTGCATFYGNNSNGSYTNTNQAGQSPSQSGSIAPNILTVTLTPNTSVVDSTNGIVSLDSTSTATGIAIQVGNKQSGLYTPQNLNSGIVLTTVPGSTTTSYTFPVGARIVKSTGDLAPGSVSSSFIYTVAYK